MPMHFWVFKGKYGWVPLSGRPKKSCKYDKNVPQTASNLPFDFIFVKLNDLAANLKDIPKFAVYENAQHDLFFAFQN